jgi:hypothetical protein
LSAVYVSARRPSDVAREVEALVKTGQKRFVLSRLGSGEMLDLERLGAARYAAGLQAEVELEGQSSSTASAGVSTAPLAEAGAR